MSEEQHFPDGWELATLGKLANYINGRAFKPKDWGAIGRPIIRIQNLTGSTDTVNRFSGEVEPKYIISDGDLLISWSATLGAFIYLGEEAVLNQHIFKVEPFVNKKFLFYLVKAYLDTLKRQVHGSGMQHITKGKFDDSPVPLPPSNEQKRIADKLDSLLARIDACQEHLARVPAILKRFRQSVLAAATSGKLTEDWREENNIHFDWETVKLSDVATSRLGKMLDAAKNRGELSPYLRNINVRWFGFDLNDIQQLRISDDEAKTLTVRKGDVLICEGGEPGRCAVWHGENDRYLFQKALHRVRVGKKLLPEWVCYSIKTAADSGSLADYFTGTTIKHFTGISLSQFELDLPPLAEQHEIVRRVEKLFAYAERLEAHWHAAQARTAQLTPALLAKAFRGELVPQDPHDEPASALLERVRAQQRPPKS